AEPRPEIRAQLLWPEERILDAVSEIARSGVKYEVGPMETVMEGQLDELLAAAKAAHLACFEAGAQKVVTLIKIGDSVHGTTIEEKVGKYRTKNE
ncbi:MAG: thiamine-binding protein, partial [Anaerolineales bacterium]